MTTWKLVASFRNLPKSLLLDYDNVQVLAHDSILQKLLSEVRANKKSLKHLLQDADKCHLLERYGNSFWIRWDVVSVNWEDVKDEFVGDEPSANWAAMKEWNQLSAKELLPLWKEDDTCRSLLESAKLQMEPPGEAPVPPEVIKVDPRTYLETKYYDSLFDIHLPLVYFVKSNLSRLENACTSTFKDGSAYLTVILGSLLGINDFDKRHAGRGLLGMGVGGIAAERRSCLAKYGISLGEDLQLSSPSVKELPGILKIREIKLQIIILLETIAHNNLDKNFENFETKYQCKLKRRSLNLTRLRALPMKSNLAKRQSSKKCSNDDITSGQLDYCEQLDLYLDKLCILDILLASEPAGPQDDNMDAILEHKKNILNKNKEASSMGFTNYVLIPYFAKKVPNAIRFTIQKLRGPSLRSRKSSEKNAVGHTSVVVVEESKGDPLTTSRSNSTVSSPPLPAIPSWHQAKTLNTRSRSNIGTLLDSNSNLLKKPAFISRTNSDLTMNLMRKRQLSVTEFSSSDQKLAANDEVGKLERCAAGIRQIQQKSFRRVGKRKNDKESTDISDDLTDNSETIQVKGTPLIKTAANGTPSKRAKLQNIVESPVTQPSPLTTPSNNWTSGKTKNSLIVGRTPEESSTSSKPKKSIKRRLFAP